ncbi:hypothetical protein LR48_Vigan09g082500 [Vigna angularis]|uniref:Uncharacterized protein n=1 Tax=Phaseolus angularis TaxID=3914 RepID=A0A0L9VAS2_PHAAN|nr:hypothetical protein LR48_Vigan09g082500 [Vigna angularis]
MLMKCSEMEESSFPTMDEVSLVNGATNIEKKNLDKKLKRKDEDIQQMGRLLDEANEIMNTQRVELEEMKAVKDKEDEASSVLEPNKNGKEDEDVEKNPGMRISYAEKAKNLMSKISNKVKKSSNVAERSVKMVEKSPKEPDRQNIKDFS